MRQVRYVFTLIISLSITALSYAQTDSITISSADWKSLLERVERLEAAQSHPQSEGYHAPQADAVSGATKVDAHSGATPPADTTARQHKHERPKGRFTIGGYGEAVMSRHFYSDHFNRYLDPANHRNDRSNGRMDLPHVVINLGYDFGHGWSMGTEIEFEHGGTEAAVEIDADEAGEYEAEVEKGGEVALEQFWINKQFFPILNLRMGEIIVPVGMTNSHHLPTDFFTCYRNEGEMQLFPCTWHQLGIELWGRNQYIGYQAMFLAGLDAERFSAPWFVHYGSTSPYEFKLANGYAFAGRVDGYVPNSGLRLSLSGYAGTCMHNTQYAGAYSAKYDTILGTLAIASFDFEWKRYGVIMRGNIDYAHLSNADRIWDLFQHLPKHNGQDGTPRTGSPVSSQALCGGIQLGYDIFHYIPALNKRHQLIPFVLYEYYNPVFGRGSVASVKYDYMERHRIAAGINYYPLPQVVIKAEYSHRLLPTGYNNEPSVSLSVAYSGMFKI
ncbi:MAG: hypothetical protein IJ581_00315 [Paludibacteraceae bacterium]|nr:hypothetical protein [Paludibacteraceae bacterium]